MKRKLTWIIIILIILIGGYFTFKLLCLNVVYSLPRKALEYEYIKNFNNITEEVIITKKEAKSPKTITFENMRVDKYNFSKFVKIGTVPNLLQYTFKEDNKTKAILSLAKFPLINEAFKNNIFNLDEKDLINKMNRNDILEKNNLKTDRDFFAYLGKNSNKKLTILSPVKEIKEVNALKQYVSLSIPEFKSITPISGDYEGYIFNAENFKEVKIIEGDTLYSLGFTGLDYFTEKIINDVLSTLIIDFEIQEEIEKLRLETKSIVAKEVFKISPKEKTINNFEDINKIFDILSKGYPTGMNYDCVPSYSLELLNENNEIIKSFDLWCDLDIYGDQKNERNRYFKISSSNMKDLKDIIEK